MAKKIPVPAVLSFWSIKGIAIPLSSHAKTFFSVVCFFLNPANAYFSKRSDFYHSSSKPFKKPVNSQRALLSFLLKINTSENHPTATQESQCFNY